MALLSRFLRRPEDVTVASSALPSHWLWSISADLFLPSGDKCIALSTFLLQIDLGMLSLKILNWHSEQDGTCLPLLDVLFVPSLCGCS